MSTDKKILAAVVLLGVCLVTSVGVQIALWRSAGKRSDFAEHFAVLNLQTNDGKGILIVERQTDRPVWGKWDFPSVQCVMYFFEGTNIVNVFRGKEKGRSRIEVTFFRDGGETSAVWATRGTFPGFNERTLYGDDGPRNEVWVNGAWHTVHLRTNEVAIQSGIMLDGKWRHLILTNGAIAVE